MYPRFAALLLLLPLPFWAQEDSRKPSPFPEKNRERQTASEPAQSSNSRSGSADRTATHGTHAVDNGNAAGAEGTGKACFFSPRPRGGTAASGEAVNPGDLIAAHATYPLGSKARVTNIANGKTVVVRIVDRLADGRRVISVSEAAARQLGFYSAGVADVKVIPVRGDPETGKR